MRKTISRIFEAVLQVGMSAVAVVFILASLVLIVRTYGPVVENALYPPVLVYSITEPRCLVDEDEDRYALFDVVIVKASYPGNVSARPVEVDLTRLTDPQSDMSWAVVRDIPFLSTTRPAGRSVFQIRVEKGCDWPFMIRTRHESPITGFHLSNTFGPFDFRSID